MTEDVIDLTTEDVASVGTEMEIEVDEVIGWATGTPNMHDNLPDRNTPNQHTTAAITGLDAQLAKIEMPRIIESNKYGVANYYEWESGAYDDAGYFVSLVPRSSKIKICDGTNIFGVTVDEAGFVGNQDQTTDRGNNYGLVVTSGLVDVRCASDIKVDDYVVANNSGLAVKTDSDCGYKVVSTATKDGTAYVSIVLGVQACTTNLLGLRVSNLEQGLEDAELNIARVMDVANEAALKAGTSDITSSETQQKIDGVVDATNSMQDTLDKSIKDIEATKQATEKAVKEAETIAGQAIDKANDALAKADAVEQSNQWILSRTEETAENYERLIGSVDKYCIGEFSQSYGLSVEQARSILKPGMIYIPVTDIDTHRETYKFTSGNKEYSFEKEFTEGSYYIWETLTLKINTDDGEKDISGYWWNEYQSKVWVNKDAPSGTAYEFWFDNTTLYKQEDDQWIQVNTLAGNVNSRISSLIRQDVDEITAEIVNAHGSVAGFGAWLTDTESTTRQLSAWKTSEEENMAVVRTEADDDGSRVVIASLFKDENGEVTESATLALTVVKDENGNPTSALQIGADSINFTAEDYQVMADNIALEGLVTITDLQEAGATIINGSNITTGSIESANYKESDGAEGMKLDLTIGTWDSSKFKVESDGLMKAMGANIEGTINAQNGQIGLLTIDDGVVEMAGKPNLVKGHDQVVTSSNKLVGVYYLLSSASAGIWKYEMNGEEIGTLVEGRTYTVQMDITPNANVEYVELCVSNSTQSVCKLPIDVNNPTSRQIITQTFTFEGYSPNNTPDNDPQNARISFVRFPDPSEVEGGLGAITIHKVKIEEGAVATSMDTIMRLSDEELYIKGEIEATSGNIGCLKIGETGEVYYEDGNTKSFYIKPGLGVNIVTGYIGGWKCSDNKISNGSVEFGSVLLTWGSKQCGWQKIIEVCKDGGLYETLKTDYNQLRNEFDVLKANHDALVEYVNKLNENIKQLGDDFNEYVANHP